MLRPPFRRVMARTRSFMAVMTLGATRCFTVPPGPSGLHPSSLAAAPSHRSSGPFAFVAHVRFALLTVRPFAPPLLRSLLTSRPVSPRRPFSRKARSPQVRTQPFPARPPDLCRLGLDHESFAVIGPLALPGVASYPVSVRRPAASLHASFTRSVALAQSRFASLVVVNSWENFHLQDCAHAGRTTGRRNPHRLHLFYAGRVARGSVQVFAMGDLSQSQIATPREARACNAPALP